jgi:hypothetical protein
MLSVGRGAVDARPEIVHRFPADKTLSAGGSDTEGLVTATLQELHMANALNWFEIPVTDMARAQRFYETLSGAPLRREPFGAPGDEMAVFNADGDGATELKGALFKAAFMKPSDTGTVVYLNAGASLDAWLSRVQAAGGSVALPRTELPEGMGCFAHILDTEGNRVGLHALA